MIRTVRKLLRWMPGAWKGVLDYYFDPKAGKEFGGPLNGQVHRAAIFRELDDRFRFAAIVETGAFRGVTTRYFAEVTDSPVYTVEVDPRFYQFSKRSLKNFRQVHLMQGDSRRFLQTLIQDPACPGSNVFFYLDAHWNADLPLYEELELIGRNWLRSVVMIDDFEVPDDPGYAFDDYGPGAKLSMEYIEPLIEGHWAVYFPSARSDDETSGRRGCVVLASLDVADKMDEITSLRRYAVARSAA
jgi:hypothetical protein